MTQDTGEESVEGPTRVRGVAREQGIVGNRRDPSRPPSSGPGRPHKPKVKAEAAERESEEVVVPMKAVQDNAAGGKGLCGGRAGTGGKLEGMVGHRRRPNHAGRKVRDKVRELQRQLRRAAKRSPGRRFHALCDRLHRSDVLREAWKRVKKNRGAAGVDGQALRQIEEQGVESLLEGLGSELQAGTYRPEAVLRRYIPRADGKKRPLGIPTVRDRVVQMAVKLVEEPILEADFRVSSYGFRPRRSATHALAVLDTVWGNRYAHLGTLVRYADDLAVMYRTRSACEETETRVQEVFTRLGLELHPKKTRRVDLSWGKEGFDFLGCHLRKRLSGTIWERQRRRAYLLHRWPSSRSMKRVRQRVKELTERRRCGVPDVRVILRDLNPVLRGWGNYFRTGNAARKFNQVDKCIWMRLRRFMVKRKGRNLRPGETLRWSPDFFQALGLHRLRGTVQYPGGWPDAAPRKSTGKPCAGQPHARFEKGPTLDSRDSSRGRR